MGNGSTADGGGFAYPKADVRKICGAMTEQRRHDSCDDTESVLQQFVHLVGCRDRNTHRAPRVRPGPPSPKS